MTVEEILIGESKEVEYKVRDILMKSEKLKKSAFSLLLSNEEMKKGVLGIFTDEIYKSLRGEKDNNIVEYSFEPRELFMVGDGWIPYREE